MIHSAYVPLQRHEYPLLSVSCEVKVLKCSCTVTVGSKHVQYYMLLKLSRFPKKKKKKAEVFPWGRQHCHCPQETGRLRETFFLFFFVFKKSLINK